MRRRVPLETAGLFAFLFADGILVLTAARFAFLIFVQAPRRERRRAGVSMVGIAMSNSQSEGVIRLHADDNVIVLTKAFAAGANCNEVLGATACEDAG